LLRSFQDERVGAARAGQSTTMTRVEKQVEKETPDGRLKGFEVAPGIA
jgi:hypothetical protein